MIVIMISASRRALTTITALGATGALVLSAAACGSDSGSGARVARRGGRRS